MKGIIFVVLTLVLGGVIALGLEWLAGFMPAQMTRAVVQPYGIGIHPLSLDVNLCGILGLICGYMVIAKFVKK